MSKLKQTLINTAVKIPAVKKLRAERKVKYINELHLPKRLVNLCESEPSKKKKIVEQFFREHPDRFADDRKAVKRLINNSPNFAGTADKEAVYTELLFYRIAYGFHPEEYVCYELDKLADKADHKKFVPSRDCSTAVYHMNDAAMIDVFNNKGKTYAMFGEYYGREAVYIEKQSDNKKFMSFVNKHPVFVKKAVFEAMGRSVEKIDLSVADKTKEELFQDLIKNGAHILEECVQQCSIMAELNESSVNTVRSITFNTKHGIKMPYFFMKIGRAGSFVDNGGAGGILVGIDADTGKLCTDGYDEMNHCYEKHPDSGITFKGYQLPEWKKLRALSQKLSAKIPAVKYIGWDFAHTDSGWVIIEGNGRSQMIGPQTVFKRGIRSELEAFMKDMDLIF